MKPLSREEIMELEYTGEEQYPGFVKAAIWLGLTAFSWGIVLAVAYAVYLWAHL